MTFDSIGCSITEAMREMWRKREQEENALRRDEAIEFFKTCSKNRNPVKGVTPQWTMLTEWRDSMRDAILLDSQSEIGQRVTPPQKFPRDGRGILSTRTIYNSKLC